MFGLTEIPFFIFRPLFFSIFDGYYDKLIISKMFPKFRILNFRIKFQSLEFQTIFQHAVIIVDRFIHYLIQDGKFPTSSLSALQLLKKIRMIMTTTLSLDALAFQQPLRGLRYSHHHCHPPPHHLKTKRENFRSLVVGMMVVLSTAVALIRTN